MFCINLLPLKDHYQQFPYVKPVEYLIESSQRTYMYVPILTSLQQLFQKPEKVKETTTHMPGQYFSYCDGSHYQENQFLSAEGEKSSIFLYVDDFEIANPPGTSKKNSQSMCSVLDIS